MLLHGKAVGLEKGAEAIPLQGLRICLRDAYHVPKEAANDPKGRGAGIGQTAPLEDLHWRVLDAPAELQHKTALAQTGVPADDHHPPPGLCQQCTEGSHECAQGRAPADHRRLEIDQPAHAARLPP